MDEIQQKIEEFKRDLTQKSPLKELLFNCPAVLPAVGLLIGLVSQFYFNLPLLVWSAVLIISILLYLLVISTAASTNSSGRAKRRNLFFSRFLDSDIFNAFAQNDNKKAILFISVFLCFVCLGSIRLIKFNHPAANDIRTIICDDFTFAHIKAQVISEPVIVENNDWYFAKYSHLSKYTSFYAKVTGIKTETDWIKSAGAIKFYISEETKRVKLGDKFQTFCKLEKFSGADNPGQFDIARYMHHNGIFFSGSVKSADAVTVFDNINIKSIFDIKSKLNEFAVKLLNDNTGDESNLVEALVLGSRTKIDRKLYNDFIKTGLVHLVCLSGLNVGIFAGVAWWFSKKAGLLHVGRSIACIIATIIFLLTVPTQSSTLRAGIMFIIFCLARLFSRKSNNINSVAVSAIFLLLLNPMDFLSPGFQFSFMSVLGILLFNDPIKKILKPVLFFSFVKARADWLSAGLAAWIAIAPLIVWHFYQVQMLTAVWTLPAMIPATVMIILGTFKILLSPLLPTLAYVLGFIIDYSAKALIYLVTIFAKVPFSNITIGKTSIYVILLFYLAIFLWYFLPFRKKIILNYLYPAAMVILAVCAVYLNKFENYNNLRLTVLSVGHGQAAVMQLPDGKNIIIDAGSMTKSNIGEKVVNPFLSYAAIDKIDSVFISHDDIDHFNGLLEILAKHRFSDVYTTEHLIDSNSNTAWELKRLYPLKTAPEKLVYGDVSITRLQPANISAYSADNESSLVLLIEYTDRKILFCSDITADVQKQIMNLYQQLDVDVIITPHHGSARTTDDDFLNYFKPEYLITSSSDVRFDRTSKQIMNFANSFYTCRNGAITVSIDSENRLEIKKFRLRN